jgi:hypothetical protein
MRWSLGSRCDSYRGPGADPPHLSGTLLTPTPSVRLPLRGLLGDIERGPDLGPRSSRGASGVDCVGELVVDPVALLGELRDGTYGFGLGGPEVFRLVADVAVCLLRRAGTTWWSRTRRHRL